MSLQWQALKPGDTVRIIAPSGKTLHATQDLEKCCDYLRTLKLNPVHSDIIFGDMKASYYNFANTDQARYEDFVDALQSDAKALWCFRGGYGCDRVIAQIIKNHIKPTNNKLFLGFSDVSILHSYITQEWNWSTLHASVLKQFVLNQINKEDEQATLDVIFGKTKEIKLTLIPLNAAAQQAKNIKGEIIGGNLMTLQSALGTLWEAKLKNKILLLEEVGETSYRIARMLFQLLHNNYLNDASAILLGDFIPSLEIEKLNNELDPQISAALDEFVALCPVPIFRINGIGHSTENYPLPFNTPARIENKDKVFLIVDTGCE